MAKSKIPHLIQISGKHSENPSVWLTTVSLLPLLLLTFLLLTFLITTTVPAFAAGNGKDQPSANTETEARFHFLTLILDGDPVRVDAALTAIESSWSLSYVPMALETYAYGQSPQVRQRLDSLLAKSRGTEPTEDLNNWYQWIWNQQFDPDPGYGNFKADLYRLIDPRFDTYFRDRQPSARIRLDEIRWGGVKQDGIPPLRKPSMITADKSDYLADDNIVFGIAINGDARAYPKRILAWHEMFTDTIGGVPIAGVYCTLCGTVIPYRTQVNGTSYLLGTSGFLYRSNKLMYDKATQSLWSTQRGEPVLGPLAGQGIKLPFESVVTTTWGEWRKRHPNTTVLSLETGHRRDYDEGAAYAQYFGTDRLMFNTPFNDDRLANKQEVLALRFAAAPKEQLAIDTDFLNKNPLYKNNIGRQNFVVFTDQSGANRVYDPKEVQFVNYDGELIAKDSKGGKWQVLEEELRGPNGQRLSRLPYHRAFWFGWHAAFPETRLIK